MTGGRHDQVRARRTCAGGQRSEGPGSEGPGSEGRGSEVLASAFAGPLATAEDRR